MSVMQTTLAARLAHYLPPGQFARYLAEGVCNTIFGYSTDAALTALLTPHIPFAYSCGYRISVRSNSDD